MKAELKALLHGLKVARDKEFKKLIIHLDSKLIVDKMKTPMSRDLEHYFIWK